MRPRSIIAFLLCFPLIVLSLFSCSNRGALYNESEVYSVLFSVGLGRHSNIDSSSGIITEKGIDHSFDKDIKDVYVVAFDAKDGSFYKVVKAVKRSSGKYFCKFDKEADLELIFVANPDNELLSSLQALSGGNLKEDFNSIVVKSGLVQQGEKQDLVMVSRMVTTKTLVDGLKEEVKPVVLERLVARFDVYCASKKLKLKKISFKNCCLQSYINLYNTSSTKSLAMEDLEFTESNGLKEKSCVGVIYSYENIASLNGAQSELLIKAELDGEEIETKVAVGDVRRNNIYNILLSVDKNEESNGVKAIESNLSVMDWEKEIVNIDNSQLEESVSIPNFTVIDKTGLRVNEKNNPTMVYLDSHEAGSFRVNVVSTNWGANVRFKSGPKSVSVEMLKSKNANEIEEEFEISIPQNDSNKEVEYEFIVENSFNSTFSRLFKVSHKGRL